MPVRLLENAAGAFGQPLSTSAGLNEQIGFIAFNNSGTCLRHGDVVVHDASTALSVLTNVTVSGAQTATVASFTLTASGSTASYSATGGLVVPATLSGAVGTTSNVPLFISYTGLAGSTFTGCKAQVASVTNGLQSGATITQWPDNRLTTASGAANLGGWLGPYNQPVVGKAAAPSDTPRSVTLSQTGAANDPLVAGVVSLTGDSTTTVQGYKPIAQQNSTGAGLWPNAGVGPGETCFVVVAGVARVQIGANTVAANGILGTDVSPSQAATTATLGNVLGIALEAQTAKDANNTIRAIIKLA